MSDFITYNNLLSKNYLKLSYTKMNSPTRSRELSTLLADAIFIFNDGWFNKIRNTYSTFETVILSSSLILSTVHSILSPALTFIIRAIVAGSVVLTELLFVVPLLIFVFCLNNITITSIMFLFIIISVVMGINILSFIIINKEVTFKYYKVQFIITGIFQKRQLLKTYLKNPMSDLYGKF